MKFSLTQQNTLRNILMALCVSALFVSLPFSASAQFNPEINYQGKLTNASGVAVPDGLYNINFWLVPTQGGATSTAVWSEARTSGNRVQVTNGLFSVMLGDVSSLGSVDFNQTLYLGVEIGGISTTTPAWDGEMSPRKILGAVPAAFVAETASSADSLSGIASSSFLRSDEADTMQATSSSPILSIIQNGAGAVARFFSGVTEVFTLLNNGNVGVGTSTPSSRFTVSGNSYLAGDLRLSGALRDGANASGTLGMILQATGTTTRWTATSSLGLGNGTYLGLSDTQSSFTANRVIYTNSGATALTDSVNFTFDGTNLGLGAQSYIGFGGTNYLYASSTNDSVVFGENAGATFTNNTMHNVAIGFEAGRYASTTNSDSNNFIGWYAGQSNSGLGNNIFGYAAGQYNAGSQNNIIGYQAGYYNTGSRNNIFGQSAGNGNAGNDNNFIGYRAGYLNVSGSGNNYIGGDAAVNSLGSYNDIIGFEAGRNVRATSSTIIGSGAFRGGSGFSVFSAVNNVALGFQAGYNATDNANNNILVGYRAADNITNGNNNIVIGYDVDLMSSTTDNALNIGNIIFGTGLTATGTNIAYGNVGIGTNAPTTRLTIGANETSAGLSLFNIINEEYTIGGAGSNTDTAGSSNGMFSISSPGLAYGGGAVLNGYSNGNYGGSYGLQLVGHTAVYEPDADYPAVFISGTKLNNGNDQLGQVLDGDDIILSVGSYGGGYGSPGNQQFNFLANGNFGIGTTTPGSRLSVVGDMRLTGAFRDGGNASGTQGMILQTTGTSTRWVATSTLGIGGGATTFLALTDTPSSYTANRVIFTNSGASALTDSPNFTFDGTNLGLGGNSGITVGGNMVFLASTTRSNYMIGHEAGLTLDTASDGNTFVGHAAGFRYSGDNSVFLGRAAGYGLGGTYTANEVVAIGNSAGISLSNSADNNVLIGSFAGEGVTTGSNNTFIGHRAADNLTTGSSNIVIGYDIDAASTTRSNQLNIGNIIFGTGLDGTGTTLASGNIGIGTTTPASKLTVAGDFRLTGAFRDGGNASGTQGMILQTTGTSTRWVATSTLGIGGGATTFLALTDTPSSYTANRIMYTNSGATALIDSADLTFDGTNLGLGSNDGIAFNGVRYFTASSSGAISIGEGAGAAAVSNSHNIAIGFEAARNASFTQNNIAIGRIAGRNAFSVRNVMIGDSAGATSTGTDNNIIGTGAGELQTGSDNNIFGRITGINNTGSFNNLIGYGAGSNQIGSYNNSFGYQAGDGNTGSSSNLFGYQSGFSNDGDFANLIGQNAGRNNQGDYVNLFGFEAGATSTGNYNNFIGYRAGADNTGIENNFIGYQAGRFNTGTNNNILGNSAGYANTGTYNNIFGVAAGEENDGDSVNLFGYRAGQFNSQDDLNSFGYESGRFNTGLYNNFMGPFAGSQNSGHAVNAFGLRAGTFNTGSSTNLFGSYAGYVNSGDYVDAIGALAGYVNSGDYSSFIGYGAGYSNSGDYTLALGYQALGTTTASSTGARNIAFGPRALFNNTTGANNIALGYQAGDNLRTGSNNIVIGYDIDATSATAANTLNIGNLIFGTGLTATGTTVSTGNIGIGTSTPASKLTVAGDFRLTGALRDGANASGTLGMVLQSTGTSTRWVATSTLGITGGASTFLSLTDTPSSYTANRIFYTNSGATAVVDSANFTYNGTDLGLGGTNGIAFGGERVISASTTAGNYIFGTGIGGSMTTANRNILIGELSGSELTTGGSNIYIGEHAGRYTTTADFNIGIGGGVLQNATAGDNISLGYASGYNITSGAANNLFGVYAGNNLREGDYNVFMGDRVAENATSTSLSVAIGAYAARGTTQYGGAGNFTVIGAYAGENMATGADNNILIGYRAADNITTGNNNIIIGYDIDNVTATADNRLNIGNLIFGTGLDGTGTTLASGNVGIGTSTPGSKLTVAGDLRVTGGINFGAETVIAQVGGNLQFGSFSLTNAANSGVYSNTALGDSAGNALASGFSNVFVGFGAGTLVATGSRSVIIGNEALGSGYGTLNAGAMVVIGDRAGFNLSSGDNNMFVGFRAGYSLTSGTNNTLIGYEAGHNLTSGSNNLVLGHDVDLASSTGSNQLNIGNLIFGTGVDGTGTTLSSGNVGIGVSNPGSKLTVGGDITTTNNINLQSNSVITVAGSHYVHGYTLDNTYGVNQFMGFQSGNFTSGSSTNQFLGIDNLGVGRDTLSALTEGSNNVAIGQAALSNTTTGGSNVAVGWYSLISNTSGDGNTAVGRSTLQSNTVGRFNTVLGNAAMEANISGENNVAIGAYALQNSTTSNNNIAIGRQAGTSITTGESNIIIGMFSGDGITTGGNNTIIGSNISGLASNLTNNIILADGDGNQRINVLSNGNTGIGTTSPSAKLDVWGDFKVGTSSASILYANSAVRQVVVGTSSYVDEPDNGATPLMALVNNFSVSNPTMLLIRETAVDQYQSGVIKFEKTQNFGDGTVGVISFHNAGMISADTDVGDAVAGSLRFSTDAPGAGTAMIEHMRLTSTGNLGLGTTTPRGRLGMANLNFSSTSTVAGIDQHFSFNNSVANAALYGNRTYLHATNTATTTIIGSITRVADSTTFGNTVRGLEVQADNGNNTRGENTGIAGFGRTFGVRGTTVGDAGGTFEPAGIYGETEGTTQGNAIRGYSSSITTAALLKLFQDTSTFTGTGLLMNFGNAGGSFSSTTASRFIDLQNGGTSRFSVGAYGMTTIGDGTTSNNAGLRIGYGGLCVDNDGSCNASTTGRISAVSYHTGNSDLAETYFSSDDLKTGEVVYLKGELSIGRASEETEKNIIGVVTTKPGLLLGFDDTSLRAGEEIYGVALAGRVPVRLSNENGEIKAGDELMLSSIPGVAMKASSTGTVVGIALEDFEEGRAYSDTYINQFGDDLVDPVVTPINPNNDPRVNDGCYYGAGSASGDAPCVPLVGTTTDAQAVEAQALAEAEAQAAALEALKYVRSETETLENGETVRVGQVVMFVSLDKRYLDEDGIAMVAALLAAGEGANTNDEGTTDTIWSRLVTIANNFVDGVLSVLTLKADRVEVTEELCVDGVCLNADDLRQLLDGTTPTTPEPEEEPEEEENEEEGGGDLPPPPTEEGEGETGTSTNDGTGEEDGAEELPAEEENTEPEEGPEEEVEESEPEEESGASTPEEGSEEPTI